MTANRTSWKYVVLSALALLPFMALGGQDLSADSMAVKAQYAQLLNAPNTPAVQRAYLDAFPSDFHDFMAVFMPPDFGQLYDGHDYISALSGIGKALPKETMHKLVTIAAGGAWDADAPNYLQEVTLALAISNPYLFVEAVSSLSVKEESGLVAFLADGAEGPVPKFITLSSTMEHVGQFELASKMREEAKRSQRSSDRGHGR